MAFIISLLLVAIWALWIGLLLHLSTPLLYGFFVTLLKIDRRETPPKAVIERRAGRIHCGHPLDRRNGNRETPPPGGGGVSEETKSLLVVRRVGYAAAASSSGSFITKT